MSTGKQRRGRRPSRSSSSASSPSVSANAPPLRIGRRGGQEKLAKLPSEPDPERDIYVVEALIKAREPVGPGEERHFFVKWLNYPASQNSWEPESNLSHDLVIQWEREHSTDQQNAMPAPSSSDRSLTRPDSKLSIEPEAATSSACKGSAKGKKRVLPASPKVQTTAQPKNREKSPPLPMEKNMEKSGPKTIFSGLSAANRSKLLDVVGSIKPEQILHVYREADGELCYLIERSASVSGENVVPEPREAFNDRLQIVSSQVFDTLWPTDALDFYERQVRTTICLEGFDSVIPNSSCRRGEDSAAPDALESDTSEDEEGSEENEFEVEHVVDVQYKGNKRFYLLKWVGYSDSDNTWEPEDSLNCPSLLDAFWASRPEADPRKKKKVAGGASNEKEAVLPVAKKPQKILGFYLEGAKSPSDSDDLHSSIDRWRLLVKWQGDSTPQVVPYAEARAKWPLTVLKFFQKYLDG